MSEKEFNLMETFHDAAKKRLEPFPKERVSFNEILLPIIKNLCNLPKKEGRKFTAIEADLNERKNGLLGGIQYDRNTLEFYINSNSEIAVVSRDKPWQSTVLADFKEAVETLGKWVADVAPDRVAEIEKNQNGVHHKSLNQI